MTKCKHDYGEFNLCIKCGYTKQAILQQRITELEAAAQAVVDGSHKDGSGFWCSDHRKLDNLKAALAQAEEVSDE